MVGIHLPEDAMKKSVFAIVLLSIVPATRAQQAETSVNPPYTSQQTVPETAPQPAAQIPNPQDQLPASLRPGHPLDQADVDVLTGKRDREIEAAREAGVQASPVMYGNYGNLRERNGRLHEGLDLPLLPLTPIGNPFFFSRLQPRGISPG